MGKSYKKIAFLIFLASLLNILQGCDDAQFSHQEVQHLFQAENVRDKKPAKLNLYMDISRSMYNYFTKDVNTGDSSLQSMIIELFTKRKDLDVELFGFGRTLNSIGRNEAAFNRLLLEETYKDDATIIDYPMDDILRNNDSSAINFIITDGVQEAKDRILSTHTLDYYIHAANNNGKNFGLFANHYNWKRRGDPSPVFIFMFYYPQHEVYVRDLISGFKGDVFLNSPNVNYKTSFNVTSPNLLTYFQVPNIIAGEFDDVQQPVSFEFTIRKDVKYIFEEMNMNKVKYNTAVYERMLIKNEELGRMEFIDSAWKKNKDGYISNLTYTANDTLTPKQEIIKGTFTKKYSANPEKFTVYKVVVYASSFPGWIYDKYAASNDPDENKRAYGLDKVFSDLERILNEEPEFAPSYTFYIILK